MPSVEETINIKADKDDIFQVISNVSDFPNFMDDVKEVEILESGDGWNISKWVNNADGRTIIWTEKDHIKPDKYRIDFELVEGDLKSYSGFWQLEDGEEGEIKVNFRIDFEFGMPVIAVLVHPILARILRGNMKQMLISVKGKLEQSRKEVGV